MCVWCKLADNIHPHRIFAIIKSDKTFSLCANEVGKCFIIIIFVIVVAAVVGLAESDLSVSIWLVFFVVHSILE